MAVAVPASTVRVLVVDDSPSFRAAARDLIEYTRGFTCIGEASDGEAGVEQAVHLRPDLVLMDFRMPGIGGAEAARRILRHARPPLVVLVTGSELPEHVPDQTVALAKEQLNPGSLKQMGALCRQLS